MSLYDVIEQRLAQDEKSIMVTVLSGERQGDKVLYNEKGDVVYGNAVDGICINPEQRPEVLNLGAMNALCNRSKRTLKYWCWAPVM